MVMSPNDMRKQIATFRRAAKQRFTSAELLLRGDCTLDAIYLAGYSVECILKALILKQTSLGKQAELFGIITKGSAMHSPDVLNVLLKQQGSPLPLKLAEQLRAADWSPALRYRTGRVEVAVAEAYLLAVKQIVEWAEEKL
jgi:hypothetical protein